MSFTYQGKKLTINEKSLNDAETSAATRSAKMTTELHVACLKIAEAIGGGVFVPSYSLEEALKIDDDTQSPLNYTWTIAKERIED
jgi:hypothetical protein